MKVQLSLVAVLGVLLLPASLHAQAPTPKASEAGEVQINQANLPTAADVLGRFNTPGVNEVEVRGLNLTATQINGAFLSTDPNKNLLVQVGNGLKPGQEVDFRTVGGQRFRVQNENSQLRFRLRDVTVADPQALARAFPAGSRVEIRGFDTAGNRVRLELRDGVVKKNEVETEHMGRGREGTSASINNDRAKDRGKDLDHSIRGRDRAELEQMRRENRPERMEKMERPERLEKMERAERPERIEQSGRH